MFLCEVFEKLNLAAGGLSELISEKLVVGTSTGLDEFRLMLPLTGRLFRTSQFLRRVIAAPVVPLLI
jgi:hypothetical protein